MGLGLRRTLVLYQEMQQGKEATSQQGSKAKWKQGKEAKGQQGSKANRQQGNKATRQQVFDVTVHSYSQSTRVRRNRRCYVMPKPGTKT